MTTERTGRDDLKIAQERLGAECIIQQHQTTRFWGGYISARMKIVKDLKDCTTHEMRNWSKGTHVKKENKMIKIIKSKTINPPISNKHSISGEHVSYKNRWGRFVWRKKDGIEDKNWPGIKAPKWAKGVKYIDGNWCWIS